MELCAPAPNALSIRIITGRMCLVLVIILGYDVFVDLSHYFFCQLATVAIRHVDGEPIAAVATIIYPQGVGYGETAASAAVVVFYPAYGCEGDAFVSSQKAPRAVDDECVALY